MINKRDNKISPIHHEKNISSCELGFSSAGSAQQEWKKKLPKKKYIWMEKLQR